MNKRLVSLLLVPALAGSCATPAPPTRRPPPIPAPGPVVALRGAVELEVVPDPNSHPPVFEKDEEFVAPRIVGPPLLPAYPPEALEGHADPARVVVRITISADGHVNHIEDSPVMASTAGAFAAVFRASTERAIRRWRFTPGHIDRIEAGPDRDGDGKPDFTRVTQSTPVDVFYDIRVDFRIVDGHGTVQTNVK